MKKLCSEKTVHVSAMMSPELKTRLILRAAAETADQARRITPSDIVRQALEKYLGKQH